MGTLSTTISRQPLQVPNGSTTVFAYNFKIFAKTDLQVFLRTIAGVEELQTVDTNYTVAGIGDETGGSITFVTAPDNAAHDAILIRRKVPRTQTLTMIEGGDLPSKSTEERLDRAIMMIQELEERLDRSFHLKKTTSILPFDFPEFVADKFLKVNSAGTNISLVDALTTGAISVTAFMQTLLDDVSASEGIDTLAAGAKTPGWIRNIEITLVAGVFTVTGSGGSALSPTNPGFVTVASTVPGQYVTLKVTAPASFKDDAHASSDLTNWGAGITEGVSWASDMPWFLHVVNKANTDIDGTDGNSTFFITRDPTMCKTPAAAGRIGDTDFIPATDDKDSILIMASVVTSDYVSLPAQIIGGFVMQWSAANTDWTVQSFAENHGIGSDQLDKLFATIFVYPLSQNGAGSATHLRANTGTAPVFTTNNYRYRISRSGACKVYINLVGDGGTDGVGAVNAQITLPYAHQLGHTQDVGLANIESAVTGFIFTSATINATGPFFQLSKDGGGAVQNDDFTNGSRCIDVSFEYEAY